MFDLQHLILFGLSKNKLECYDGGAHCALPFATRDEAEGAFLRCAETLARWKGPGPAVEKRGRRWHFEADDIKLDLLGRVLRAMVPVDGAAFFEFHERFWQPSLWPRPEGTPPSGGSYYLEYSDTSMNLASHFMAPSDNRSKGWWSGRADVSIGDVANIQPAGCYYGPDRKGCLVDHSYYVGPPDLIVEILAPATAAWVRGLYSELYARAGVPYFWVAIPETCTLETWSSLGGRYRLDATYQFGDQFRHPLFPDEEMDVHAMLFSRWKQPWSKRTAEVLEEEPAHVVDLNETIPLQNLLLIGHPVRRYEVLDGRTPCVVAFGSEAAARQRFREWAAEIARWENTAGDTTGDRMKTPLFDLRCEGPRVALDVSTGNATYQEILRIYHNSDAWDEYNEELERERPPDD